MKDFSDLFQMGQEALSALDNAKSMIAAFKSNFSAAKSALGENDVAKLEAQLADIHAKNLLLSEEVDNTMAQLQARG